MKRDIKYTYKDWWEGRIYFGGQTIVSQADVKEFSESSSYVKYNQLSLDDENRVKRMQKKLHLTAVKKRFNELKQFFVKSLGNSSEPHILIKGILGDLNTLFNLKTNIPLNGWIELKYLERNIYYGDNENLPLKNFLRHQIINGRRSYDHMQSPKQLLPYFTNPPFETWVDAMYKYFQWLREKDGRNQRRARAGKKDQKSPQMGFSLSKSFMEKHTREVLHIRLSDLRLSLRDPESKFLSTATTLPVFKRIFLGKEIVEKVIWTGTVSELVLFINQLKNSDIIEVDLKQKWNLTVASFILGKRSQKELTTKMLRFPGTKPTKARASLIYSIISNLLK